MLQAVETWAAHVATLANMQTWTLRDCTLESESCLRQMPQQLARQHDVTLETLRAIRRPDNTMCWLARVHRSARLHFVARAQFPAVLGGSNIHFAVFQILAIRRMLPDEQTHTAEIELQTREPSSSVMRTEKESALTLEL